MPWRRMATHRAARKRFRGIHNGPSLPESGSALRNRWEHLSFGTTGGETTLDLALLGRDLKIDCGAAVADPRNRGLNDIIACAGGPGVVVADVYPRFAGKGPTLTHVRDEGVVAGFHPTNAGYEVIANTFMDASR